MNTFVCRSCREPLIKCGANGNCDRLICGNDDCLEFVEDVHRPDDFDCSYVCKKCNMSWCSHHEVSCSGCNKLFCPECDVLARCDLCVIKGLAGTWCQTCKKAKKFQQTHCGLYTWCGSHICGTDESPSEEPKPRTFVVSWCPVLGRLVTQQQ